MTISTIFDCCEPRREVLAGEFPDSIFAADLWDVIRGKAHGDYQDPSQFFEGTHPTQNLKRLVKDVAERLAGIQGVTPFYKLETGFGGGKTHGLIACVHVGRHGAQIADSLSGYEIRRYPEPGSVRIAAFVGENSSPLEGVELEVDGQSVRTFTPWGQLALMAGGLQGYERIKESDLVGVAPTREDLESSFGDGPLLILIDELVLYMARCFAMPADHARGKINSQWPTFLQTLSSIASQRPQTAVLLTFPTEKDANARFTGELKQHVAEALDTVHETEDAAIRKASSLTPTQSTERGAVLARRLFTHVDKSRATEVAETYVRYYEAQRILNIEGQTTNNLGTTETAHEYSSETAWRHRRSVRPGLIGATSSRTERVASTGRCGSPAHPSTGYVRGPGARRAGPATHRQGPSAGRRISPSTPQVVVRVCWRLQRRGIRRRGIARQSAVAIQRRPEQREARRCWVAQRRRCCVMHLRVRQQRCARW